MTVGLTIPSVSHQNLPNVAALFHFFQILSLCIRVILRVCQVLSLSRCKSGIYSACVSSHSLGQEFPNTVVARRCSVLAHGCLPAESRARVSAFPTLEMRVSDAVP